MCYLGSWGKLMTRDAATPLVITAKGVLGRSRGWVSDRGNWGHLKQKVDYWSAVVRTWGGPILNPVNTQSGKSGAVGVSDPK